MTDKLPYACNPHDFKSTAERLNSYYPNEPIHVVIGKVMKELGGKCNPHKVGEYLEELREDEPGED